MFRSLLLLSFFLFSTQQVYAINCTESFRNIALTGVEDVSYSQEVMLPDGRVGTRLIGPKSDKVTVRLYKREGNRWIKTRVRVGPETLSEEVGERAVGGKFKYAGKEELALRSGDYAVDKNGKIVEIKNIFADGRVRINTELPRPKTQNRDLGIKVVNAKELVPTVEALETKGGITIKKGLGVKASDGKIYWVDEAFADGTLRLFRRPRESSRGIFLTSHAEEVSRGVDEIKANVEHLPHAQKKTAVYEKGARVLAEDGKSVESVSGVYSDGSVQTSPTRIRGFKKQKYIDRSADDLVPAVSRITLKPGTFENLGKQSVVLKEGSLVRVGELITEVKELFADGSVRLGYVDGPVWGKGASKLFRFSRQGPVNTIIRKAEDTFPEVLRLDGFRSGSLANTKDGAEVKILTIFADGTASVESGDGLQEIVKLKDLVK
ncbi:MAG: hypothetical protein AB7K68_02530 [Bacteriovoracia bacterium]